MEVFVKIINDMKKKFLLIACIFLFGISFVQSQTIPKVLDKNNMKIKEIAQTVDDAGWVYLKKDKKNFYQMNFLLNIRMLLG